MSDPRKMVRPSNDASSTRANDWDRFADEGSPLAAALAEDMKRLAAIGDSEFKRPSQTRIIAVANQKGGVGNNIHRQPRGGAGQGWIEGACC